MFSRIGRLFRGFLGLFISGIEESNPEALMEAARQEFRTKMTQYNLALAKMAGVAERLKSQVKSKADRAQELERRILANHRAGNMDLAGTLARRKRRKRTTPTSGRRSSRSASSRTRSVASTSNSRRSKSRKRRRRPRPRSRASRSRSAISATP